VRERERDRTGKGLLYCQWDSESVSHLQYPAHVYLYACQVSISRLQPSKADDKFTCGQIFSWNLYMLRKKKKGKSEKHK
jgi:hypothetical protein